MGDWRRACMGAAPTLVEEDQVLGDINSASGAHDGDG